MNYDPLAIHSLSLCFDILENKKLANLSNADITDLKEDIYWMISERTSEYEDTRYRDPRLIEQLATNVIIMLHSKRFSSEIESSEMLLSLHNNVASSLSALEEEHKLMKSDFNKYSERYDKF